MELPSIVVLSTQQYEEFYIKEKSITQILLEVKDEEKLAQVKSSTSAAPSRASLKSSINALCKIVTEFICNQTQVNGQIMRKLNRMEKLQGTITIEVFNLNKENTTKF